MAFTEFYCNASTGSNVNAGSTTGAAALSLTGGDWVSATGVFTKTGAITGVSVGDFAAVRVDAATVAARIGRVTAVTANTITISTTAGSGSLADQTATCSVEVGGVWKGPNAAVGFPLNFITNACTNSSADTVRVNLKNNATYSITAEVLRSSLAGPIVFQGYTTTAGDGGRATIDGGTSGASYKLLRLSSSNYVRLADLIFQNNGATGSAQGIDLSDGASGFTSHFRLVVNNVRGAATGIGNRASLVECEFYGCNQSNTASTGIVTLGAASCALIRCVIHDNSGSGSIGCTSGGASGEVAIIGCIFDTNGSHGLHVTADGGYVVMGCEFYNNGGDGLRDSSTNSDSFSLQNCNFIKNGGYGVNDTQASSSRRIGQMLNCGFGSGTQANTSGATATGSLSAAQVSGTVTYATDVTPWVDPANGDFRITLAAAKGAGRGSFTQTAASYAGTVGYPDIGGAQHLDSGGAATPYVIGS